MNAILVLEDGKTFRGRGIGGQGEAFGEVVFNTSMTGYQEITSDPSYCGQIVTFTVPHVGNYGVSNLDNQEVRPVLSGVVVRDCSARYSNWRAESSFSQWLARCGIVGITEVDTRALTRHLRTRGAMRAGIWTELPTDRDLVAAVRASPMLEGRDLTARVSATQSYVLPAVGREYHRLALLDFGVKRGILRQLASRGITVEVLPASTSAEDVLRRNPHGVVLSNGPGDPAAVCPGIETVRQLVGKVPILGICMGHQLLGLALGAKTYKLRFGHHGGNHPVRDERTGEVWITAQNHGFALETGSLSKDEIEVTHVSLYDGTLEGFQARRLRAMAVQFHPEGCPGPSDAAAVFDRFVKWLE